ncbi:pentatricopeptide repeat-containing protein chloroplastic-like isoform X1 [Gossypium australe]|uniref:Pentatricopeptide repeat-containing protein chloroplastic-like isoform X1 n=1 Tax=Gossypium australe TaxID=47621 RepID=A0A5B6V5Y6_9ROSI|nr:pentatricopeptide repeat-containing protein chloroplastic-like isoform X1 [Gossypium australe]
MKKAGKNEHHLWEKRDSAGSGQKALNLLRIVIADTQMTKWMLSKGQVATMGTYGTFLLAFDMENRVDEAGSLWNLVLHTHNRSILKRLFSRMISLFDHHSMPNKIIETWRSCVKLDENTVRKVVRAFQELGQEDK